MIDQTISHYRITGKLGAGGMGEVYRASDTALNREVALKVLPAEFARDAERTARSKREAQMLASLNHPNIAAIYGMEETDGTFALVMELVEGDTIADRILHGRIPFDEVLQIVKQIADALEAAHEKGIIHRDLKPANVKVTPDGTVKVLDFGLAKALEGQASSADLAKSPTISIAATQAGIVLGTAAYMSPEQARGKNADRRSDVWSFGVVFFEMLTGKQAFVGETVSDTLAGVLRAEPEWSELPASVPPAIHELLHRCMTKDPKHRLQSIGDARITIEEFLADPAKASAKTVAIATVHSKPWAIWLMAALAIALVASLGFLWQASRPVPKPVTRFAISTPANTVLNLTSHPGVAISQDGSKIAMIIIADGNTHLYVRKRDEFQAIELTGTTGASGPVFSPDGNWIAFVVGGNLMKISSSGGPILTLAGSNGRAQNDGRGISWASNDSIIFAPDAVGGLFQVSADGGPVRALTTVEIAKLERTHRWPMVLPGGETVMFTVGSTSSPDNYDNASIDAVNIKTGARRNILQKSSTVRYSPSGHLVFSRAGNLYAVAFDPKSLEVKGAPFPVLADVSGDVTTGSVQYSISQDGTLVYVPGELQGLYQVAWVDRKGQVASLGLPPETYLDPKLSPDGKRAAVSVSKSLESDIWIYEMERKSFNRFTFGGGNWTPTWSNDGKTIYYSSCNADRSKWEVRSKPSDGSRDAEVIFTLDRRMLIEQVSPDGKSLYVSISKTDNSGRSSIYQLPLVAGSKLEAVVSTKADEYATQLSPNGQWLAYQSDESGRAEVYVRPVGPGGGRWQVSVNGGEEPRWSHDGRELYYRRNIQLMVSRVETGTAFQSSTPTVLLENIHNLRSESGISYSVDPSNTRFLMIRRASQKDAPTVVRVVENWSEELQRQGSSDRK